MLENSSFFIACNVSAVPTKIHDIVHATNSSASSHVMSCNPDWARSRMRMRDRQGVGLVCTCSMGTKDTSDL